MANNAEPQRKYARWVAASILSLFAVPGLAQAASNQGKSDKAELPAPPANGELGFVLTAFSPAIYQGKNDCPDGLAGTVKQNYLETLSPAERTRLTLGTNEKELTDSWKAWVLSPDGSANICSDPELFDRTMRQTIKGAFAYGLNLDGEEAGHGTATSRAHTNFRSPDGLVGVDNESYRVLGCTLNYRGIDGSAGDVVSGFNLYLATGEHSMVLLLRGVDNLRKDDDVELIFATTGDRPIVDGKMNFIRNASFAVSDNPRWRTVMKGRIENGVLTSDPADVHLTRKLGHGGTRGARAEWDLRQARFRLTFQPDGSVKGLLGAYQPIRNVIESETLGGIGAATTAGLDCAAHYGTLKKFADGPADAATGMPTISTALTVEAVPAFVTDALSSSPSNTVTAAK